MLTKTIIVSAVLALASATPASAQQLKIATVAPDSTTWMKQMRRAADAIKTRTDGRVVIKFYPGGVMGNDQAVLRKMRIGQLHGGAVTSGALSDVYPDAQVYSLPMQFRSLKEVNYVRDKMDAAVRKGAEEKGMVILGMSNGGFAYVAGRYSVAGIADLKNQRVWVPQGDEVAATMFEAAGISPVPLPMPDVYTALQTGLLDTVIANPSSIIAFQWHTKVNYLMDAPMAFLIGMLVLDERAIEGLEPEDQAVLKEVIGETFARLDELNHRDNVQARKTLVENGVELIKPTEAERKRWDEIAASAVEELKEEGRYSSEFLSMLKEHLRDYRQSRVR